MKLHYINYKKTWGGPCSNQPNRKYTDKGGEVTCSHCLKKMGIKKTSLEEFINGLHQLI